MEWTEKLLGGTRGEVLAMIRRSTRSINELARELGISDNAVRAHIAALLRDGLIEPAGLERATGGKPAHLYRITAEAEELYPKAYALVLSEVLCVLEERGGGDAVLDVMRIVGSRAGASQRVAGLDPADRVRAAAEVLRSLGGEVEVEQTEDGWFLWGCACPLSAVVARHPQVCLLAQALVAEVTGQVVTERCDRSERARCAFHVAVSDDEGVAEASVPGSKAAPLPSPSSPVGRSHP